jgi:hypothetical protein
VQENCQFLEIFEITGNNSSLIDLFIYKKLKLQFSGFGLKNQNQRLLTKLSTRPTQLGITILHYLLPLLSRDLGKVHIVLTLIEWKDLPNC